MSEDEPPDFKGEHIFTGDYRESETSDQQGYSEGTPLTRLFGGSPKVKIIAALLSERERELDMSTISRLSDLNRGSVYRHLEDLLELGVVKPTRQIAGTQLYSVNEENPIMESLSELEMEILKKEIENDR